MLSLSMGLGIGTQQAVSGGGGSSTSTWNPADKQANITLTNSNNTATLSTGSVDSVRSTAAKASGYLEYTITNKAGNLLVGIDAGTMSLTDYPGDATSSSVGYQASGGAMSGGGTVLATYATYTTGDTIAMCYKAGKVYFGKWNGSAMVWGGTSDPSAGTGGLTPAAAISTGFAVFCGVSAGDAVTINTGGSSFLGALPTGVTAWG